MEKTRNGRTFIRVRPHRYSFRSVIMAQAHQSNSSNVTNSRATTNILPGQRRTARSGGRNLRPGLNSSNILSLINSLNMPNTSFQMLVVEQYDIEVNFVVFHSS
jgi:hypothetical protein